MKSDKLEIEEFLDHVDQWKFKLQEKLKGMTPTQRKAFWKQIREEARADCRGGRDKREPTNQTSTTIRLVPRSG